MLDRRTYRTCRLAWLYQTGEWPENQIDHINRDRDDDRWANLRPATNAENGRNAGLSARNTSGVKGVCWHRRKEKWQASIRVDRRLVSLGYFLAIDEAAVVRKKAERQYFGEFAPQGDGPWATL